jgi:hypothetical protein
VGISYDAQYGFPISIVEDSIKLAVDDEIAHYIDAFKVLP